MTEHTFFDIKNKLLSKGSTRFKGGKHDKKSFRGEKLDIEIGMFKGRKAFHYEHVIYLQMRRRVNNIRNFLFFKLET